MLAWLNRKLRKRRAAAYLNEHPDEEPGVMMILMSTATLSPRSAREVAKWRQDASFLKDSGRGKVGAPEERDRFK